MLIIVGVFAIGLRFAANQPVGVPVGNRNLKRLEASGTLHRQASGKPQIHERFAAAVGTQITASFELPVEFAVLRDQHRTQSGQVLGGQPATGRLALPGEIMGIDGCQGHWCTVLSGRRAKATRR